MFNWKEFIDLANELLSKHNITYNEANYRTIISRCYYGVFKQVEDYLKSLKIPIPEKDKNGKRLGSHERIIYFLRYHTNSKVRSLGYKLMQLKDLREDADYHAWQTINIFNAQKAINKANKLSKEWLDIKNLI